MVNRNLKETKTNIISKAYKTDEKSRASNSLPYIRSEANLKCSKTLDSSPAKTSVKNTGTYQQDNEEHGIIDASRTAPSISGSP